MDISTFRFVSGKGDGETTACLFSARSLLDGRPFTDEHPSATLRNIGIRINDGPWWDNDEERTRTLLPLALDERLCASKCIATPEVERARAKMAAHWALSWAAPFALDQAALALEARWPEHARKLRVHSAKLREEPTQENALTAKKAAAAATAAAAAAATAYAAAATDAAYADAAAAAYAYAAYAYAANVAAAAATAAAYAYAATDAAYADAAAATAAAYAYAANVAAAAATAAAAAYARISARKPVRDSLIELFRQMLGECGGQKEAA